jgi:hypothetical protein
MSIWTETVLDNFTEGYVDTTKWTTSDTQTVTSYSSSTSWTPTQEVMAKVEVTAAGAGGQYGAGSGGGAGEYACEPHLVLPAAAYTITTNPPGAGGTSTSTTGRAANNSAFVQGSTNLVLAHGGPTNSGSTSTGGTGSTNTIHYNGGGSTTASASSPGGSGGGSSGGSSAAGNNGSPNSGSTGGAGGVAVTGGGAGGKGGNGGTTPVAGTVGAAPGGGGGSGGLGTSTGANGAAGGNPLIKVTYTYMTNVKVASNSLQIKATTAYPALTGVTSYDISNQIVACKWNAGSGTATASTTFTLGVKDAAGNSVNITSTPISNYGQIQAGGSATCSDSGSSGGLGTDLANGSWIGIGMMGNDKVIHIFTSVDGIIWNEIRSAAIGGTFTKTAVKIYLSSGYYTTSESPTWISDITEVGIWDLTYRSILYDNFSASEIDTSKWNTFSDDAEYISTATGACVMTTATTYPTINSLPNFDFSHGIMAFQYTQSGTPTVTSTCEFQFGIIDESGANVIVDSTPSGSFWQIRGQGGASITNDIYSAESLGIGSWVNGNWLAVGNLSNDDNLHFYKSSDGENFTEIASAKVSGINTSAAGLSLSNGYYDTTQSPTFTATIDNVTKLYDVAAPSNTSHVRVGGSWVQATPKVRVGGSWVTATAKSRVGGSWVASS